MLLKHCGSQIKDIWKLGLLLGLRIDELLQLQFSDLTEDSLYIKQFKARTHSIATISLHPKGKALILNIKKQHPTDKFVFQSRNSRNIKNKEAKPISRQAVYRAFKEVGDIMEVKLTPNSIRHAFAANIVKDYILGSGNSNFLQNSQLTSEIVKSYYHYKDHNV